MTFGKTADRANQAAVHALEHEIDHLTYQRHDLTKEKIAIVKGNIIS